MGKITEEGLKGSKGQKYGAFEGRRVRGMMGKQTGDVWRECGLKEAREGGAGRISEARQKPSAAEGAGAFHLHQP